MDDNALVCAYELDRRGNGKKLESFEEISQVKQPDLLWLHFDRSYEDSKACIDTMVSLDEHILECLLAEETRPRCQEYPNGLLIILRGVNTNPGSDPEDMVSIRIYIEKDLIVSVRARKLLAVHDIRETLEGSCGPKTPGEFVVRLTCSLLSRIDPFIQNLEDAMDDVEERFLMQDDQALRNEIVNNRTQAIMLRRYISPQREAINRLLSLTNALISEQDKTILREAADHLTRYIETLDVIRERSIILQDEIMNRTSDKLNRNTYALTIVATIFLPLGFLTGLLGINVAGIPGGENKMAFTIVSGLMLLLVILEIAVLRVKKWF